jgi:hypothetical protein
MPSTSLEKRIGRRNRVIKKIKSMKIGDEFTAQDIATSCNLSSAFAAGRIITGIIDELKNFKRIQPGVYMVVS